LNLKSIHKRRDYANNNSNNSDNRPRKQHKMSCLILHMWIFKENEYVQQRTCDRYLSFSHEYEFSWTMVYCNRIDL